MAEFTSLTRSPLREGVSAGAARPPERGIGRSGSRYAERVSDELRRGTGDLLRRRRRTTALSLASTAALGVVTAYQAGLVRHLPEPPLRVFDADRVDASGEAYRLLAAPDAALGVASFAATAVLATVGGEDRVERLPLVPLALAAKAVVDALGAGLLTLEQGTKHRRYCFWCLCSAVAAFAAVPQVLPEARLAWRHLRGS